MDHVSLNGEIVANAEAAEREFGIVLRGWEELPRADALIVAVAHRAFLSLEAGSIGEKLAPGGCFIDVKSQYKRAALAAMGYRVWRL